MKMRIVIVEDEIRIREGLIKLIKKVDAQYEVVGEAENGKEGFSLVQQLKPDLVITDIRMPVMDGLCMLTKLQEEGINVTCIVLSAYSEFEYARQAIKLNVSEYVIKPVGIAEFTESLKNVESLLAHEKKSEQETPEALHQVENIFISILLGNVKPDEELGGFLKEIYQMDIHGNFSLVPVYLGAEYEGKETRTGAFLKSRMEEEYPCILLKIPQYQMILLVVYGYDSVKEVEKKTKHFIAESLSMENKKLPCAGFMEFSDLNSMKESLAILRKNLDFHLILGEGVLINYPKVLQIQTVPLSYPLEIEKQFKEAFCTQDKKKVAQVIGSFCDYFVSGKLYSPKEVKESYIRFLWAILGVAGDLDFLPLKNVKQQELLETIMSVITYQELRDCMQEILTLIIEYDGIASDSSYMVNRTKSLIHEYYMQGITLEEIATQLHISPEYLGTLFYKETGEYFTTYIRTIRVKKAKELLLGTTLKLYEVAERVGYTDPKYFSRVFKTETGELPQEYRKRHK